MGHALCHAIVHVLVCVVLVGPQLVGLLQKDQQGRAPHHREEQARASLQALVDLSGGGEFRCLF